MKRRRVAYCSPVNPVESGISDYSEELLPYLGQYVDLTLVVDADVTPSNPQLAAHLPILRIGQLEKAHRRQPFDAIIYHMGNSAAHSGFWLALQKLPGVVVLHDYVLHHLMLWHAANRLKNLRGYREEIQRRYGEAGSAVAIQMERGQLPEAVFNYPLNEAVIEHAKGLIGHSRYVVDRVTQTRPDLPSTVVSMGVPLPEPPDRLASRQALNLPIDAPIWASFGHANPYKRLEVALRAFARFKHHHPTALYLQVGSVSTHYPLEGLIKRLGLQDAVKITGYVSHSDFAQYVAAADICFNGRYPSAGETSASLLRLLGAGRAVLVSDVATFSELPTNVVAHVPIGAGEERLIATYAERLWSDDSLRHALETNARQYVAHSHSLEGAAAGYAQFLSQLYGWEALSPLASPLWELEQPLASTQQMHPVTHLIGQRAAGLGLQEDDISLLERAVKRIKQLLP